MAARGKKQKKEPAGMNCAEIFAALAMLEKERGIPQSFMMDKIIQALTTAYKRDHSDVENVIVDVDEEHQTLKMYVQKNVVDEEDYVDPPNEMTLEEAKERLSKSGFAYKTVGSGATVTDQTPAGGAIVPGNASIILYLGQEKPDTPCTVPNVVGKSASEANKAITNAGLIMKVTGTTTASSGNVYAITQSLPAGTEVAAGTVVTVQFGDNSVLD
mgnify:CR=1 FL=1